METSQGIPLSNIWYSLATLQIKSIHKDEETFGKITLVKKPYANPYGPLEKGQTHRY
jgi:hypothetical protein